MSDDIYKNDPTYKDVTELIDWDEAYADISVNPPIFKLYKKIIPVDESCDENPSDQSGDESPVISCGKDPAAVMWGISNGKSSEEFVSRRGADPISRRWAGHQYQTAEGHRALTRLRNIRYRERKRMRGK